MNTKFSVELSSREAIELLAHPATSKQIHNKIIKALRAGNVYPKGALAAATAQGKKALKQKESSPQ